MGTRGNDNIISSDDKEDESSSSRLAPTARGSGLGSGFEGLMILDEIDAHVGYVSKPCPCQMCWW